MIPGVLKGLLVPGSFPLFLMAATVGVLLLFRKNGGRAGRLWIAALVLFYWILSTPITALALVRALSPSYPPVNSRLDARGATAIVVLGAGFNTYRSRGAVYSGANREHALRMMEAARVYKVMDRPWVIVTGGLGNEELTEAAHMAVELKGMGVDEDRIVEEGQATNTRDHALFVPPLLKTRGVTQFVLVTSQEQIARALRAFHAVGLDPIPSTPEVFVRVGFPLEMFLPSDRALAASTAMIYDELAMAYYWARGWI